MDDPGVLIVGMGGLGVPAALKLAQSGIARLALCDADSVDLSNLARQPIYELEDCGQSKVEAAAQHLGARWPGLKVRSYPYALNAANADALVAEHAFIIDATDNPNAKFIINDACLRVGRPFVYGGVLGLDGQALTVIPGKTACLRCIFESPPLEGDALGCHEAGILGPVAAVIGQIEAAEAIGWISGTVPQFAGRMLVYDASGPGRLRTVKLNPRPGCPCTTAIVAEGKSIGAVNV